MPTWVVILINSVLLVYCVVIFVIGHRKKKKRIDEAKKEIHEEFKDEIENHDEQKQ